MLNRAEQNWPQDATLEIEEMGGQSPRLYKSPLFVPGTERHSIGRSDCPQSLQPAPEEVLETAACLFSDGLVSFLRE
jgi:hypothetical protein